MEKQFETQLVLFVKEEMLPKSGKGCQGGGGNRIGFDVVGGKEEGEVSFSG